MYGKKDRTHSTHYALFTSTMYVHFITSIEIELILNLFLLYNYKHSLSTKIFQLPKGIFMILKHAITQVESQKEVKSVIKNNFKISSRLLSKLKNNGSIKLNGNAVTVRKTVTSGDILTLEISDNNNSNITPKKLPFNILYEDEYLVAVNKPSGMPTHPSSNHHDDTLANAFMFHYQSKNVTFRPITRLDCDTTGVVLIAKDSVTCQRLTNEMQKGNILKEYYAVCVGIPNANSGIIDAKIERLENSVIKRKIGENGKQAITEYIVEKTDEEKNISLIHLYPKTGRTHQLRLHLSHIGCPIYSDFLYGTQIGDNRALLHCYKLNFKHPFTDKEITINAPIPDDMRLFED